MANGNFVPFAGRSLPPQSTLPTNCSPAQAISGNGAPEGVVPGNPGQRYTNLLTGDLYQKQSGAGLYGWQKVGTVGSAGITPI